jgi:hypothetical protein
MKDCPAMAYKFLGLPNQTYNTHLGVTYTADAYGVVTVPYLSNEEVMDMLDIGLVSLGQTQAKANLTATADPTSANDNTQDYGAGSIWVNSTNGRVWHCQSAATGAAAWALEVVPGVGIEPSSNLEQFGSGTATMLSEGNVYHYASAGLNPASTAADYVVAVYSIPANSFDGVAGTNRGLNFSAYGGFANNTNAKRCKIIYNPTAAVVGSAVSGGTTIADTGSYSTTGAVGWNLQAQVFKYGAAGSNTQYGQEIGIIIGTTHGGMGAPLALTATENAVILVAVTANATTAATDITLSSFQVNATN